MGGKKSLLEQAEVGRLSEDETSLRYMLRLAAPMIVTTVSFTVMQFVDRLMVSRLGTAALAAILPAGFVSFIPGAFILGVFVSVATFVSQSLGRGEKANCSSYCWQAIYMGLVYAGVVLAIGWPLAPAIFEAMGHEPDVAGLEVIYFRIMLYATIVVIFAWASSEFFMGIHRPIINMYASLCAQVINVAANYVLIFGKLGFPAMGIAGAGWGTVVGIVVGDLIRMAVFLCGGMSRKFESRRTLRIDLAKMVDLIKVGVPAGLELMLNVAIWGAILFWLVGGFGKEAQAATSAALACTNVSIMPIVGIRIALTAAVGKSIGAGRVETAVKQTSTSMRMAMFYVAVVGLCFLIFREQLMRVWSSDDRVIETGAKILILAAVYQTFHAIRTIYSGVLRGAGDTIWLAIASAAGAMVILGMGGYLTVRLVPGIGSAGPWTAGIGSVAVMASANYLRFRTNRWKQIDLFKRRAIGVTVENGAAVKEF